VIRHNRPKQPSSMSVLPDNTNLREDHEKNNIVISFFEIYIKVLNIKEV